MKLGIDNIGNNNTNLRFTNNNIKSVEMNINWVITNKYEFLNEVIIYSR